MADEGARFTDYYGEQSCTAGRAAFITGQNPYRTGLTKVGFTGADIGLRAEDPTIATALKAQGYATGQFGKPRRTRRARLDRPRRQEPPGHLAQLPGPRHRPARPRRPRHLTQDPRLRHREPGTVRSFLLDAAPRLDHHLTSQALEDITIDDPPGRDISEAARSVLDHLGWPLLTTT